MEISYVAAINFLLFSHWTVQRGRRGNRVLLPRNPIPLYIIGGISGLIGTAMTLLGFFIFPWWLPAIALLIYMFLGAVGQKLQTSLNHPLALYGMVSGAIGLILAGVFLNFLLI